MKRWLYLILLCSAGAFVPKIYHKTTAGFSLKKIYYQESFQKAFSSAPITNELLSSLNQDFYYLGQGRQVFVFQSKDGQYVLKFVRCNHYRVPFRHELLAHFNIDSSSFYKTRREHYQRFFMSYKIALEELSDLTGVVFIHLNPTVGKLPNVKIYDRLKRPFIVNLDQTAFLIQKKGVPLTSVTDEEMKKVIDSLFQTILTYKEKNIAHYDLPNLIRNVGVYQSRYMEMDVGSYAKKPLDKEYWTREMKDVSKIFIRFLEKNAPDCIPYFKAKKEEFEAKL